MVFALRCVQVSEFNKTYTLQLEDKSNADDLNFLRSKLVNFNRSRVDDENFQSLFIFLRDGGKNSVGGLYGVTYWQWLYVDLLWVEENVRLQGHGHDLLAAAEQEAIRRGCKHAYLDTFSFQALPFYKKQGYTVFGELPDFPTGYSRYFLKKNLL